MSHPVCSSKLFESWLSGESKKHNKTPAFRTLWKTPESGHYAGRSFFSERWSIPSPIRAPIACSGRLLALIQQKTALLFWKSFISLPISQSGVELQLKITANSTYWEANLISYDLEARDRKKTAVFRDFWTIPKSGYCTGRSIFLERWSIPSPIRAPIACFRSGFGIKGKLVSTLIVNTV